MEVAAFLRRLFHGIRQQDKSSLTHWRCRNQHHNPDPNGAHFDDFDKGIGFDMTTCIDCKVGLTRRSGGDWKTLPSQRLS